MVRGNTDKAAVVAAIVAASAAAASPTLAAYRHWGGPASPYMAPYGYGYAPFDEGPCVMDEGQGRHAPRDSGGESS
jgi:hypothetical protein